ncbi:MAG TPA: DUF4192 domain-containing protein [Kineosporiaceae bacterium]|nr:DUF4192 domain-containing protein [Kineosporiaceae bacterium]
MQTIVRGGPRDLIALAWYRIGFRPRESLVLVGLRGGRRRSGVVVRADLPAAQDRDATLVSVLPMLRRGGSREVVALVVSDAGGGPRPGPDGLPVLAHRDLDHWLRHTLPRHGIGVFDVLAVGPDSFRKYDCPDPLCCPPEGWPLDDLAGTELAAHMVLAGRMVADREEELVRDVRPQERGRLTRQRVDAAQPADLPAVLARWRELVAAGAAHPDRPAELLAGLRDVRLRDAVMFTLVPGSGLLPEQVVAGQVVASGDRIWELHPDHDLVERGRRLLAALARVAPAGDRAEVLSVLAWLAWWCCDAVRSRLLAGLALADRPGHRLSSLVAQLLAAGIPPTWQCLPGDPLTAPIG